MNNLQTFESYREINEGKAGIHFAIRNKLIDFIKKNPEASYEDAKKHIADTVKGWDLSKDDFEEAKDL
jgi:hypothetical protein